VLALTRGRRTKLAIALIAMIFVAIVVVLLHTPARATLADNVCVGVGDGNAAPALCVPAVL